MAVKQRELLKISQLAKRAGVGRGTIQHYLREGLLPRPVKTHRNMAYYDAACVERIKTIKELQARRFMPLSVIRKVLGTGRTEAALAKTLVAAQQAALDALTPPAQTGSLTPEAAAKSFKLRPALIEELRRLGMIATRSEDGKDVFAGADLEVLAAVKNMETLGFRKSAGFKAKDLLVYRDSLEQLMNKEVQTFVRVAAGRNLAPDLARSAVDAATMLVIAVRRKLLMDLLSSADSRLQKVMSAAPSRTKHTAKKSKPSRRKKKS